MPNLSAGYLILQRFRHGHIYKNEMKLKHLWKSSIKKTRKDYGTVFRPIKN